MRVAIIGAGVSGMSCAFELEKHGIEPVIFEKGSQIGDTMSYAGMWSRILNRSYPDPLYYLEKRYGFSVKPMSRLREITLNGPKKKVAVSGKLGYIFKRGLENYSVENQIAAMVKTKVTFDSFIELEDVKNRFDFIVVANANATIAKNLRLWTDTYVTHGLVATVLGNFKTDSATLWLNKEYAKNTFSYIIPNSSKEASLVLVVNGITAHELDFYWKEFLAAEDIRYPIIETKETLHSCGFVYPHHLENIYFVGNAAGFTDDLAGFGAFNAIESGILAARAIAENLDYDVLVKPIVRDIHKLHELRKAMNRMDNKSFDRFLSLLGLPGVKQFVYNNPLFKLSQLSPIARCYTGIMKETKM